MRRIVVISLLALLIISPLWAQEKGQREKVLAIVGGQKITQADLDYMLERMPRGLRARFGSPENKKRLLEQIIEMKLFAQAARGVKLDGAPEVKRRIEDNIEGILAAEYVKRLREGIEIKQHELKAYYEAHKNEFQKPEQIRVRHMALETEQEAKEVLKSIKEGKDFAALAKEKSIGPNKEKGGDLGWVTRGRMHPELEKAAFSLKKGEISEIIHTKSGYHIIKLEDRKEAKTIPFDKVKERIKRRLRQQKEREVIKQEKERLAKELGVQIIEDALK